MASILALASLLLHPFGPLKAVHSTQPLLSGADVDPAVLAILERSCQNCHSDKTEWPWYSYIAPMSLMVESDVSHARNRMNLSHWSDYTVEEQQAILTSLGAAIRSREMPPGKYTAIHPGAKLSAEEREQIYRWARGERRRLSSPSTMPSVGG